MNINIIRVYHILVYRYKNIRRPVGQRDHTRIGVKLDPPRRTAKPSCLYFMQILCNAEQPAAFTSGTCQANTY